jgi:methylenetetrahydrofolate reductase (NADPH)
MLTERLKKFPSVTYYAVNRQGALMTNTCSENTANALTWGVFPGQEIVQPTIVDTASFLAWKVGLVSYVRSCC